MSLQRYFEIWAIYQGDDREAFLRCVAPDGVWEEYANAPGAQTWRGPEGVRALMRRWEEDFDGFGFEPAGAPEELAPGTVAIPVRVRGVGRGSGVEVDWDLIMVTEMRDGMIVHLFFADTMEEARARAG